MKEQEPYHDFENVDSSPIERPELSEVHKDLMIRSVIATFALDGITVTYEEVLDAFESSKDREIPDIG